MADYIDGTYVGRAQSLGGELVVTLTIAGGAPTNLEVTTCNDSDGIGKAAAPLVAQAILGAGTPEGVDGVAGATVTSGAVFEAATQAFRSAETGYNDGVYRGAAQSIGGYVELEVTVEQGVVADVRVLVNNESDGIGKVAVPLVAQAIADAGTPEGVDGVAGATVSSQAVLGATAACLAQACGSAA